MWGSKRLPGSDRHRALTLMFPHTQQWFRISGKMFSWSDQAMPGHHDLNLPAAKAHKAA